MTTFIVAMPPMGKARPRVTKRGHAFMPEDYRQWKLAFGVKAKAALWGVPLPLFPKGVHFRTFTDFFTKTGNCRSDMDNCHAAVLDALQDAGIIVNDRDNRGGAYDIGRLPPGETEEYIKIIISLKA